jgi:RNA polymerase sigma factor (sigma-70 family)
VGANLVTEVRTAEADPPWEGLEGPELFDVCLRAARTGDRIAMHRLVAELTPLVWNVARGYGLDRHTAEDVVQTVWLALFSHLDQVREPKALAGWLATTARHEAQRVNGRKQRPVPLTDEVAETMPSTQLAPEAEVLRSERDRRLWWAFGQLSYRCQEILRLTVLAGRAEYRIVAESLRIPRGSIGPNRGRCLKAMRELLDEGGSA